MPNRTNPDVSTSEVELLDVGSQLCCCLCGSLCRSLVRLLISESLGARSLLAPRFFELLNRFRGVGTCQSVRIFLIISLQ